MNTPDNRVDQVTTESIEDLELTNQQAEEAKAGKGSGTLQGYMELKLDHALIS